MPKPVAGAVVPDEEYKKKSVYYEACTSPFKDDLPILVKCLVRPPIAPAAPRLWSNRRIRGQF